MKTFVLEPNTNTFYRTFQGDCINSNKILAIWFNNYKHFTVDINPFEATVAFQIKTIRWKPSNWLLYEFQHWTELPWIKFI